MKKIFSFPGVALICILVIGHSFVIASAPTITGPNSVCPGTTGNVYTTEAGYSNYVWNVSSGGIVTAGGALADRTVTITWNNPGAQSVSVNYDNPPGTPYPSPTTYNVTVKARPDLMTYPLAQTICNMGTTNILLTSSVSGTYFTWTATPSSGMVMGYSGGSGVMIMQTLMNFGYNIETVTYAITPHANGCNGNVYNYVVTINPTPDVSNSPLSKTICSNSSTNIILTSNVAGTAFGWTATGSSGMAGYSSGTGNIINQVLVNPGSTPGTVTYSIAPSVNGCNGTVTNYVVTVNPVTLGGTVTGGTVISLGSSTDTLVLTGKRGTVMTWQKRPGDDPFTDIPSTAGLSKYIEVPGSAGTWEYRAKIQNGGCTVEYSIPDTVFVVAGPVGRAWNGSANGNWNNAANWSPAGIPASGDDVTIPAGASHIPVVNVNGLSCHNLHISQGATLLVNPGISLITLGDVIVDGP